MTLAELPGLTAVVDRPVDPVPPLRTDIAVFAGRARRGPVGSATEVQGWREHRARYGGLGEDTDTAYAVRAYFDNGGERAWIVRLAGAAAAPATGTWEIGTVVGGTWSVTSPARGAFAAERYRVEATSPGSWATGTEVRFRFRAEGLDGQPEVDVRIAVPGEAPEYVERIRPSAVAEALSGRAVRLLPVGAPVGPAAIADHGPMSATWRVVLQGGVDDAPVAADYTAAVPTLAELPEPALVVVPDLYRDVAGDEDRRSFVGRLAAAAAATIDRLVLLDIPPERATPQEAVAWVDGLRATTLADPEHRRAVAVYHPRVCVADPLGGAVAPLRALPGAGPVAGVASRLDRERGAHDTPANATIYGAVDLAETFTEAEERLIHGALVNLLRCSPGSGLQIWGGRTLDDELSGTFIAHRRLIHRLVPAIRRVADPLVFDINGPELWFALYRAIFTVLLEAFRSGALAGAVPDEGFRVQCDEELNPPEQRDVGQVHCLISVAPATPMEFITLRLTFGLQGQLEVVEA